MGVHLDTQSSLQLIKRTWAVLRSGGYLRGLTRFCKKHTTSIMRTLRNNYGIKKDVETIDLLLADFPAIEKALPKKPIKLRIMPPPPKDNNYNEAIIATLVETALAAAVRQLAVGKTDAQGYSFSMDSIRNEWRCYYCISKDNSAITIEFKVEGRWNLNNLANNRTASRLLKTN